MVRQDLTIGPQGDSAATGMVFGTITEINGSPFVNARVVLDGTVETKTDDEGRFVFRKVASGTRQLEILSIGMVPVVRAVDVVPNDTTPATLSIRRITALDVVRVSTSRRARSILTDFEARKASGAGYTREAGDLITHADLGTVFREFPSALVDGSGANITVRVPDTRGGYCVPELWVDGAHTAQSVINSLRTNEIVMLEMYIRPESVPLVFRSAGDAARCGVIAIWTTWSFAR